MTTITKKLYEQMQDEHVAFVYKNYGDNVSCNLGWVTDTDGMCTKIYSNPREYVNTQINSDGTITHSISK